MINKIYRVIKTTIVKCIHFKGITINGLLNICNDTKIKIAENGKMIFGENLSTLYNVHLSAVGGKIEIGNDVFFNRNCVVVCRKSIIIGDKCLFGPNVCIYDHDHEYDCSGIKEGYKATPIIIDKKCWIGANVIILRGTHIGEGSIIGAGTVVKGDIPAYSIVTDNRKMQIRPIKQ